ncbi:cell division protein FtsZ [Rickettsiales endosymbiont of Stachyamoeba lipophora]|nr:cell division protein FtsZ [Rickettsiales endosymbiont of Stachyamoeba lipophora]AZL15517.1 cell division protein FtsZ [Rickettsiales endosymbiont of Stachyamoeba lipophora]
MALNLNIPENIILKPTITVFGVGGAGCNAVNNMIESKLDGANFIVANTDAQALEHAKVATKLQLGEHITRGLGAGASPEIGAAAAEESAIQIESLLEGSNMVFITAGMGGGTGTGAAPVVAKIAKAKGILTVGVVTKPFHFEGAHRMRLAEMGLKELEKHVDTLIVIPNQNLFRVANERTTFADAFKIADDVLHAGVRGVTDLITMPGLINLDFADIVTIMSKMGKAMMGTGEAKGDNRAIVAAEAAIANPLLDHSSMKGAAGVLINISGGYDMTLFEVDEAANRIREEVEGDANIIFGSAFNPALEGVIRITVVATGIDQSANKVALNTAAVANDDNTSVQEPEQEYEQKELKQEHIQIIEEQVEIEEFNQEDDELAKLEAQLISQHNLDDIPHPAKMSNRQEISTANSNLTANGLKIEPKTTARIEERNQKSGGLFSRFANSLGFGATQEIKREKIKIQSAEFEETPEDIEIPAFLRRKTK